MSYTIEQKREINREYYLANREYFLSYQKEYQKTGKYKTYQKKYQRTGKFKSYRRNYLKKKTGDLKSHTK